MEAIDLSENKHPSDYTSEEHDFSYTSIHYTPVAPEQDWDPISLSIHDECGCSQSCVHLVQVATTAVGS